MLNASRTSRIRNGTDESLRISDMRAYETVKKRPYAEPATADTFISRRY